METVTSEAASKHMHSEKDVYSKLYLSCHNKVTLATKSFTRVDTVSSEAASRHM